MVAPAGTDLKTEDKFAAFVEALGERGGYWEGGWGELGGGDGGWGGSLGVRGGPRGGVG